MPRTPLEPSEVMTGTAAPPLAHVLICDDDPELRQLLATFLGEHDLNVTLAAVSHDLRTPLTRLRLRCAHVKDIETRQSIEADLDEMEAMIDAALEFLRTDKDAEEIEHVDLSAVVQTIADDAADAGRNVEVRAPRSLVIRGRHLALKRAITNLVQNAVRYAGSAFVEASATSEGVRIVIRDEGPGITADKLEAVFEPFYRVEASCGRATGGYGLGLTSARGIARAHGGEVVLVNRSPRGLDAVITLPVGQHALAQKSS